MRDWYAQGLADTPSTGKLHHHLRLLGWEKDGENLLFTNIQLDNFTRTFACFLERLKMEGDNIEERKWIMMGAINLGMILEWASGMICQSGGLGTREGSNLDGTGVHIVTKKPFAVIKDNDTKMDIDGVDDSKPPGRIQTSPATSEAKRAAGSYANKCPASFRLVAHLTFSMLSHILKSLMQKPSLFAKSTLNPYMTIVLKPQLLC